LLLQWKGSNYLPETVKNMINNTPIIEKSCLKLPQMDWKIEFKTYDFALFKGEGEGKFVF